MMQLLVNEPTVCPIIKYDFLPHSTVTSKSLSGKNIYILFLSPWLLTLIYTYLLILFNLFASSNTNDTNLCQTKYTTQFSNTWLPLNWNGQTTMNWYSLFMLKSHIKVPLSSSMVHSALGVHSLLSCNVSINISVKKKSTHKSSQTLKRIATMKIAP